MKIILAHNFYNPIGGAEVFYREVGRVLTENGHSVAYFSPKDPDIDSPWEKYFPKPIEYNNTSATHSILNFGKILYSTQAKNKFKELIRDFQPDIVHVFAIYIRLTPAILDACSEEGVRVVMSCNDYKLICPNYKLFHHGRVCEECKGGRFYRAIVNQCCHDSFKYSFASAVEAYAHKLNNIYRKNVDTFLFASEFMAHKTEEFWGKESFQWRTLRNPFDSTKYTATYRKDGNILYFGRLIDEKGVDVLLKAASKLPNVLFRIVGEGPDMSNLKLFVKELNLSNIVFTGAKWGEALNDELSACRFVVVPSVWHENFPYVIIQSFAYGKPVIGSNRGGIPELIHHGERGLVYEANDEDGLVGAINQLWNDSRLVKSMGQRAKIFADREFNDENFYQTIVGIYEEVLS